MKRTTLPNTIGFRVSEEQWRGLEEEAENDEISVHVWCREAALEKLKKLREAGEKNAPTETGNRTGRVADERALLEEIARALRNDQFARTSVRRFTVARHLGFDSSKAKSWVRKDALSAGLTKYNLSTSG
jgi:hypothetical protein